MKKKLELKKETIRELTESDLKGVAGGNRITELITMTQSPVCPSGATWLQECYTTNNCA